MIYVGLKDVKNNTNANITKRGQLIVSPISFNAPYFRSFEVANTAYNFIKPISGKRFIIDGLIFSSDKNVSSTNGAVISIYEGNSETDLTGSKNIFTLDIGRLDKGSISGLNVITSAGIWLNGKTDDATTNVTVLGYYVEE